MQQMHAADPKTEQEIRAFIRAYKESFNANDAAALAALCTEDAIQIGPERPICGQRAIEKKYFDLFRESHPTNIVCTIDQVGMLLCFVEFRGMGLYHPRRERSRCG